MEGSLAAMTGETTESIQQRDFIDSADGHNAVEQLGVK
jgi:hypothetical protein